MLHVVVVLLQWFGLLYCLVGMLGVVDVCVLCVACGVPVCTSGIFCVISDCCVRACNRFFFDLSNLHVAS